MNAVGIDVSKGKSTVAIMQPLGVVVKTPYAAYKRLPLEGKLSAARLTDEVSAALRRWRCSHRIIRRVRAYTSSVSASPSHLPLKGKA